MLYLREPAWLRAATSLTPHYLTSGEDEVALNLNEYGHQLGRRFRSLKLWFVLRALGLEGARVAIGNHVAWAQELRALLDADPDWEVLAPSPFSTLVFRHRGGDDLNEAIEGALNGSGEAFISHTKVRGSYALRAAIGNLRTTREDVLLLFDLLKGSAAAVGRGAASTP